MRTVTVTGHGEARVVPDSAVVRVAAVHRAAGVAEALSGADRAAARVASTAREFTTPDRVGSSSLQLWRDHDQEGRPSGFSARHSLAVRCADIAAAGAMLTALAETVGDALEIDGVSLEATDQRAALVAAREAAYDDAVDRATRLAGLAGAELGDVQDVVEGVGLPVPIGGLAKAAAVPASFQPGETSVTTAVTVSFQLR